ncbi:MAG: hypothetical protein NTW19_12415 [Planctomycetota bacterium]|nr:hypothetical protein [Planctomycetota bacterium]
MKLIGHRRDDGDRNKAAIVARFTLIEIASMRVGLKEATLRFSNTNPGESASRFAGRYGVSLDHAADLNRTFATMRDTVPAHERHHSWDVVRDHDCGELELSRVEAEAVLLAMEDVVNDRQPPDWEFRTLLGLTRDEMRTVISSVKDLLAHRPDDRGKP